MSLHPVVFAEPGLWTSVWRLLRLRLLIMVNGFRRAKTGTKIGYLFAGLGLLVLLGFLLFISISLLGFFRSPEIRRYIGDSTAFLESIPTMMVSIAALGILVTGFGVLLQVLYLSGDMDFLMSAPIPIRAVFIAKMVQAVLPNFLLISAVTLPILYGLGISGQYNFLYYPLVLVVLILLSLAAASLASLLVMVAARYFPARRLAEVLGFVVGTTLFILSQSIRFIQFDVTDQQVSNLLNTTSGFSQPWSPLSWAGRGLVELGKSNWLLAFGLLAAALLVTGAIFYFALVTSERLYYIGWSSLQNNRRKQRAKPVSTTAFAKAESGLNPLARVFPAPIRAILVKDWLVYRRDLRNLSQLITPLILGVIYAISLLQGGGKGLGDVSETPSGIMNVVNGVLVFGDVALALFIGWMLVANLAGLAFSQEGKNYWILKTSPITSWQLLMAKFLVAYLPTLVICTIYLVTLEVLKSATFWNGLISFIAVAFVLAGLTGIYLSFGTRGAKFDWENPAQKNQAVGCLGNLASILYLAITFGLFVAPPVIFGLFNLPILVGQLVGLVLGGGVGLAAAIVPLFLVEKKVATLAEN